MMPPGQSLLVAALVACQWYDKEPRIESPDSRGFFQVWIALITPMLNGATGLQASPASTAPSGNDQKNRFLKYEWSSTGLTVSEKLLCTWQPEITADHGPAIPVF